MTYRLDTDAPAAARYYPAAAAFTDKVLARAGHSITPLARSYHDFIAEYGLEDARSVEEYTFELLNLCVLWRRYGSVSLSVEMAPFHLPAFLSEWRKKHQCLRPAVDLLRGILMSFFPAPREPERTEIIPCCQNSVPLFSFLGCQKQVRYSSSQKRRPEMGHVIRWPGIVAASIIIALLWTGCSKNETTVGTDHIVGSGRLVSEIRPVAAFDGIQVTNFGKVFITQDTVENLRIESDDNIIGRVHTSVSNGVLVVGLENGSYSNVTVNVYASMRRIRSLESVGAADFLSSTPVHPDTIVCRITGAGSIALAGTADEESVEIVGAGNVRNFDLESSHCIVSISGTGSVEVTATRQLDALIAGTGSIVYGGNPAVVHQSITGVGSIQPRP